MPASDFYVQPSNPLGGLQDVIGRNIAAQGEQQRSESDKARLRDLLRRAGTFIRTNDHASLIDLMTQNPELREHLSAVEKDSAQFGKTASDKSKVREIQVLKDALISASPRKVLEEELNQLRAEGGDTTQIQSLLDSNVSGEELNDIVLSALAMEQPESARAYIETTKKPAKKFSMGSGLLAGYAFDSSTGKFTIDKNLRGQLEEDAIRLAKKEKFKPKDVAGINDKVTALTKPVREVHAAAISMSGLNENSTPAAQLAAIFKFMKALDPRSVVREGEQQQAVKTGGVTDQFIGYINQLRGEGKLTADVLQDMTNTSAVLANSAIESSIPEVGNYLNVIADNLTQKQLKNLRARVPKKISISDGKTVITNSKGWPLKVDAKGNKAYVGPNDEIEEVQ